MRNEKQFVSISFDTYPNRILVTIKRLDRLTARGYEVSEFKANRIRDLLRGNGLHPWPMFSEFGMSVIYYL